MIENKSSAQRWADKMLTMVNFAGSLTELVTASHPTKRVGCVIVDAEMTEIVGFGYNGCAMGEHPTDDESSDLHSEVNALVKANTRLQIKPQSLVMIVTIPPCGKCAGYVLNARTVGLVITHGTIGEYSEMFDPSDGVELLVKCGIPVLMIDLLIKAANDPDEQTEMMIAAIRKGLAGE